MLTRKARACSIRSSSVKVEVASDVQQIYGGWTPTEDRLLVEFWREWHNNSLKIWCGVIPPEDYRPNAGRIVVSCIYWELQEERFWITSVDIISLLKQLLNINFEDEEKGRIRRNIEGYGLKTVRASSGRGDRARVVPDTSNDLLYTLIMGFGHPKPRNMQKDIKIFPWNTLLKALPDVIPKIAARVRSVYLKVTLSNTHHGL